jgi:hypothetical protein
MKPKPQKRKILAIFNIFDCSKNSLCLDALDSESYRLKKFNDEASGICNNFLVSDIPWLISDMIPGISKSILF